MASEVRIVGAGISGLACARVVAAAGHHVVVHESSERPGGRMCSRWLASRPVDLGAAYLTCRDEDFRTVVDDWLRRGLVHPWTTAFTVQTALGRTMTEDGPVRYGARRGLASLVEDLAIGIPLVLEDTVARVGPGPTLDGHRVDAVVLAMPDPQAHRLLDPACQAERAASETAPWAAAITVAAGWSIRHWDIEGVFVHDDPVVEWIADDGQRRADLAPVLVTHATAEFAAEHLADPYQATATVVEAVQAILAIDTAPTWTYVHAWPYARPAAPRSAPYHVGDANIALCGDAWGSPRVETAWLSGHRLGQELVRRLR